MSSVTWDSKIKQLGIRGSSYVVVVRKQKRQKWITLGPVNLVTPTQARERARRILLETTKIRPAYTVADLCELWLSRYARVKTKRWRESERRINNRIIPALGSEEAESLSPALVQDWHNSINGSFEANRCVEILGSVFNKAILWGFLDNNPCKGVVMNREPSRRRFVSPDEMPRLLVAVETLKHAGIRTAIKLCIYTGCRPGEALALRWSDIDNSVLIFRDTKNGSSHSLPMTTALREILATAPRKGMIVCCARNGEPVPVNRCSQYFRRLVNSHGLKGLQLRDLRRTFVTWSGDSGASLTAIRGVVNQRNVSSIEPYLRSVETSKHELLERHARAIKTPAT